MYKSDILEKKDRDAMALTTQDLTAIKGIVDTSVKTAVDTAIDNFAITVAQSFNDMSDRLDTDFSELKADVSEVKNDVREVKWHLADTVRRGEFLDVRQRVERLERGK
jgi:hypothetical protein